MPSIQVTPETLLSYIDSGIPTIGDGKYKTLVVIHGFTWSGETFRPSIREAPSKSLRIISISRRGFLGSTPLSDDEIQSLQSLTSNEDSAKESMLRFMAERSSEFGSFIHHLVENESIPAPDGHGNGGIALMGWSFGNAFAMNMIHNARHLKDPYRATLMKYVTSCVFYDPPAEVINIPPLPGVFAGGGSQCLIKRVLKTTTKDDPNFPVLLRNEFNEWVSGWFHFDLPNSLDPHGIAAALEKGDDNPIKPSTWKTEAATGTAAFADCYTQNAGISDTAIIKAGQLTGAFAAICDGLCKGDEWRAPEFERFKLSWMYCENSCWIIIYPAIFYKDIFTSRSNGELRMMLCVPGANHFLQWNDPEKFLSSVMSLI